MRKRNQLFMLLAGFGAATGLTLTSCIDYTTGQDGEPEGPLMITRMTLFDDHVSRDSAIFTDTSAPADCKDPSVSASDRCQNDPTGDNFGVKKSTPTPDSGQDIRVVFNKLPLLLDGKDLEKITKEPMAPPTKIELTAQDVILLKCAGCTGIPANTKNLRLTGSELSPDPTVFPYGPSIQISVDTDDPLASMEPDTEYSVEIKAGLSDRAGNKVSLDGKAQALLRFTTEPLKVLQAGIGDVDNDEYVYTHKASMHEVADLANDGVIALKLNASADPSVFKAATAKATMGGMNVAVKIGVNQITTDEKTMKDVCDPGNQRTLYIYPASGTWGAMPKAGDEVTITVTGADVVAVSQAENHPAGMGKKALKSDYVIKATLSGSAADDKYTGLTVGTVAADDDCPMEMAADMSMPADMTMTVDGSQG